VNLANLNVGTTLDLKLNFSVATISEYLVATGDDSDMWIQESIVPPPLVSAGILAELMKQVKLPSNLMHTGQEQTAYSTVPANSDLLASITLVQYSNRQGAIIATFEATLVDVTQVLLFQAKIRGLVPLGLS
jgi:hypothetical protein